MFDSYLPFTLLTVKYERGPSFHIKTYVYRFKTIAGNYIAHLEEYECDVFIIKFYPAFIKRQVNRFHAVVNKGIMRIVVGTSLRIMLYHFNANPRASFGFIASASVIGKFKEDKSNNQRFRIFQRVMLDVFGEEAFSHFVNLKNSAYLMINNCVDVVVTVKELQEKFADLYIDLFDLEFSPFKHEI